MPFDDLQSGALLLLTWSTLPIIIGGMTFGLVIGVIPGMTAALGMSLILPLTLALDPLSALLLLTSVYTGSLTGGGILAILINTPGTPGAVATTFDGYPMTRQGRHNEALGLQIMSSVIGGLAGYFFLLFFIQPMTWLALQFGSDEMLALVIFVLVAIGFLEGKYIARSIFAGVVGLLLATIGTSIVTDDVRGTFGIPALEDGLPIILCVIGLFAVPELIAISTRKTIAEVETSHSIRSLLHGAASALASIRIWLPGSMIGIAIGILPAAGATLASLTSYRWGRSLSPSGNRFGQGEPHGIVAAETANNASEGGAMSILLSLGIPGSASTAVILGGFLLHGLVPGGTLFRDNGPIVYGLILGNMIEMVLLGFVAIAVAYVAGRITTIPTRMLVPLLFVVLFSSAYSYRNEFIDVYILLFFGLVGWIFKRYHFTLLALMIGLFLGQELDENFERVLILYGDDPLRVLESPLTVALSVLTIAISIAACLRSIRSQPHG